MSLKLPPFCRHPLTRWIAIGIAIAIAVASASADARTLGALEFEPCTLAPPVGIATTEAQCATLSVPENRAEPGGRQIELAIAWIPGDRREEHPDPVFMLAGGPGQSARDSFPQIQAAFRDVGRLRDIILLDQRGTGASHPLKCDIEDEDEDAATDAVEKSDAEQIAASVEQVRRCLAGMTDSDPRFYTTTDAIADLDAVREAIGVEQINLVGISYGTRVAQQYAQRYAAHTRSVVLDSPVPNELILGQDHAKNLESALDRQLARCTDDKVCHERFGNPREKLATLVARLREGPIATTWRDPQTGIQKEGELGFDDVASLVRMYSYLPMAASMLPLVISEAVDGRSDVLRAQAQMLRGQMQGQFSRGMELSVMCSEDADQLRIDAADADTLLGTQFIELAKAQCAVWPHGDVPADFHQPLRSDIPFLLLTGEFDPVTPPRYGEQIMKGLSNARLIEVRGQGHNVIPVGCMPRLLAEFIDSIKPADLDTSCLDSVPYTPPFAGFYGWEP